MYMYVCIYIYIHTCIHTVLEEGLVRQLEREQHGLLLGLGDPRLAFFVYGNNNALIALIAM